MPNWQVGGFPDFYRKITVEKRKNGSGDEKRTEIISICLATLARDTNLPTSRLPATNRIAIARRFSISESAKCRFKFFASNV